MKLLYAFPEPLPLPRARGVQVAHAIRSLAAAGVSVDLAYVPVTGMSPLAPAGEDWQAGVSFIPLSRGWPSPLRHIPPFSRWHSVRFFASRLLREIARRRPEAIYVRHLKLAAQLLRDRGFPPLIYEAHEVFADTANPRHRKRIAAMEQLVLRMAAAIVCNSRATAARLEALYGPPRHLLVLPNGVAVPNTLPTKPWERCGEHIIYAGSFFGWKGVADLISASAALEGLHISLVGGEPAQLEKIRAQLPSHGAHVELTARLPHKEVMSRLANACIAVLPNRPEPDSAFTSPIKLFEYMAAGCAVVASDLPAIREILDPEDAIWFTPGDVDGLAAALRFAASDCDRARTLGQRSREKGAAYSWDGRARRLKAFIEQFVRPA